MPVRPILFSDNPVLRQKSRRVRRVNPASQQLIDDMVETMRAANGIGLAAIQIGVPERVIVVELPEEPEEDENERQRSQQCTYHYRIAFCGIGYSTQASAKRLKRAQAGEQTVPDRDKMPRELACEAGHHLSGQNA